MSKKHRKISLIFIGFLLALLTIVSFAEPPEAPNQLITENPYKEVKTVEANKNREHAEMNIGVKKLKVKEIEGIELESGEIVVYLPEEKIQNKMIQNEVYYVADSVDIFSETTDRKKKKNVEKNINKIEFERKKDYITIKKNNSKELFLGKIDLEGNALKEIWGIKKVSRALDIGGCQIVIRDWDVIKKYLDIFNTTELTFYYASMGGLLRVSPGNTPSINNFTVLESGEYSHTHTGNSSSYDPKAGCLTYTTGSYIKKFDISKGGQLLRHIDLPDTSGGVATMGYIVDSMFYTVYPENELISTFAITKNRYGYKDETNINEHALVYRLNFGGSVSQALKNIDEKFGKDTFEQKFDYTTHRVLTTREHNSIFRINPQIKPAPLGNIDIDLANPMVAGTIGYPPGRIRIYSNSISSSVPLIGNLGNDDMIISSDIKNGQYKLNKASGSYIPINPNELGGNKVDITINTGDGDFKTTREIFTENSDKFNGMMSTAYNGGRGGIEVGVDYQQSDRSNYGTDISLTSWDLEAKNIKVTMKHPLIENIFNISVPEFNAEFYYNKNISQTLPTEIDYSLKVLQGNVIREHSGEMKFKFNIGTKDYDLRILEADNNKINLSIKIPKQVILEVTDSLGNKQSLPFVTEVTASTGILGEDANYYYIHAPNDGWTLNSAVNGVVTLKTMYKTNISITSVSGNNLNLVSIGAKSYRTGKEKRTTIVDKVDLKVELANFNETIDASSLKILENLFTNNEFYGLIQNENRIVLKDGTTEIFNTTLESLKTNPQQILNAGVAIKYNEATNKFEFIKEKYVNYNGNLKLEIRSSNNLLLYIVNLQLINSIIETNAIVTFDRNDFNFVQGDEAQPYGRIRISSTSNSDLSAKMGIIDATDQIVTDKNRKNGQFLQGKITGSTYPLQEHHFGKTIDITVGSHKRSVKIADDLNENPMVTQTFSDQGGIVVRVDYQSLGISNGGIDFSLKLWDGEAKSIPIKVEYPDGAVSNYTVNIPEFEGKNYYNEDLPLANEYLPTKKYTKDINEFMSGELDRIRLGTKDYDLRILGENALGLSNLRVQIPREITLEATDSENNTQNLTFAVSLRDTQNGAASIEGDNYILNPTNNGYKDINSAMAFDIILTGNIISNHSLNNLITLKGKNINLVSIGAVNSKMNKMTTIIDEVEYKINYKNSLETIDFRDKNKGDIILGNSQFEALDTNKVVIKDKGVIIFDETISELKKGIELPDSGVKIIYDATEKKLKFEKIGYKDYSNENLVIELRSKDNLLLRTISLKLYNKVGFEILPGRGVLDFGHFMPGDFKRAESLIEFKNPSGAKISVDLNPINNQNMYKLGVPIAPNTTIPLSNIQIKDLKNGINKTNNFKISGEARTTTTTEVGEYEGKLDVIITIIP